MRHEKKQEQANREQSKAPVAKKKDPFLEGFNQSEEEEKKEKSHLDFVSSGGKSKAVDPNGKQMPWRDILTGKKEIAEWIPEKSNKEKLSGKEKRLDMYRKWERMNEIPSQSPESQKQVKRKVWEGPIDYSKENREIFNPERNYEKLLDTIFDGKPRSFKLIDKNGKEKPADIKFNSKGEPEAVKLKKPELMRGFAEFGKEAEAAMARGATPEELQALSKEKNPFEWEKGKEYVVDEYGKVYELPRVDKSTTNELKLNQPLEDVETAFSIAEWFPGIDNIASLGSAVTNVIQGDWGEAGLDLLGALPLVNEVRHGAKVVDAAVDFGKGAKRAGKGLGLIDEAIDAGKAASKTSGKLDEIIDLGKAADKIDDIHDVAKVTREIPEMSERAKNATALSRNVAKGLDKTDNATVIKQLTEAADDIAVTSPIKVPMNANKEIEYRNSGYFQMKCKWTADDGYTYTSRWHNRTPGAPEYVEDTWVIERRIPGIGYGKNARDEVREVLIGENKWVAWDKWYAAIKARKRKTATKEQEALLDVGHWKTER